MSDVNPNSVQRISEEMAEEEPFVSGVEFLDQWYRENHFRMHRLFGPTFICIQPHYHEEEK